MAFPAAPEPAPGSGWLWSLQPRARAADDSDPTAHRHDAPHSDARATYGHASATHGYTTAIYSHTSATHGYTAAIYSLTSAAHGHISAPSPRPEPRA